MRKAIAVLVLAAGLAGCDMFSTVVEGFKYAHAVEGDLAETTGLSPQVGFQWTNGHLISVTVTFPRLVDAKPVGEVAQMVRAAVAKEFRQKPEKLIMAFAVDASAPAATEQPEPTH
jgi:hypothetical protein